MMARDLTVVEVSVDFEEQTYGGGHHVSDLITEVERRGAQVHHAILNPLKGSLEYDGTEFRVQGEAPKDVLAFTKAGLDLDEELVRRLVESSDRIDVIHAHSELVGPAALTAAALRRAPVIYTAHVVIADLLRHSVARHVQSALQVYFAAQADALIAPSRSTLNALRRTERAFVIPHQLSTMPAAKRSYRLFSPARVLFVGRLVAIKGLSSVVPSFANLPVDTELWVVGDGRDRAKTEALIHSYGLRAKVFGWLPREAVLDLYRRVDILVMPSRVETAPLTLVEAMAAGVPIIANDLPAICELVQDGVNGLLVRRSETNEPEEVIAKWRSALSTLLSNSNLRRRLGRSAMEAKQPAVWDEYMSIYRSLSRRTQTSDDRI